MTELTGRSAQVAAARDVLARVGQGRHLLVDGESGAGKTALLRAIGDQGERAGFTVARARGHALEREFPFGVARQIFEPILSRLPHGSREALLSGAVAPAKRLVWGGEHDSGDPASSALHGLYWLAARLAERQPLLIIVDDLQWADVASTRWLSYLVRRSEGVPVVVAAARTSGVGDSLLFDEIDAFAHLDLPPLTVGDLTAVTHSRAFARKLHEVTAGNPYLVSAVLQDAPELSGLAEFTSETVARWVLSRMHRAGSGTEPLARAVAILGDRAELHVAAELAGLDVGAAAAAADALLRLGFLHDGLGFVHSIVWNAVNSRISAAERLAGHTRAARLLYESSAAPKQIAVHLLAAEPIGKPWASRALVEAAATAMEEGDASVAVTLLRRALREPGERAKVLLELGRAELRTDLPAAVAHLTEAYESDPAAAEPLATAYFEMHRSEDALDVLDKSGSTELEIVALNIAARLTDLPYAERLDRLRPVPGAARAIAGALAYRLSATGGDREEAIRQARTVLELGPPCSMRDYYPYHNAGLALCRADELADAERCADRLIAQAATAHQPVFASNGHALRALTAMLAGRLSEVAEEAATAADIHATISPEPLGVEVYLASALIEQGRLTEAEGALTALGLFGDGPESYWAPFAMEFRGWLRELRGDPDGALADHLETGRRMRAYGVDNPGAVPWRSRAAMSCHKIGDQIEALRLVHEELELARAWGARRPVGVALRALGLISGDPEPLHEAVDVLKGSPARLEYAYALYYAGRGGSRALLREAYVTAHACGATPLLGEVAGALNRMGARRPRPPRSDLTAQERRVAELAAGGATNREIAEELFLTQRTVETHLTSAYRKLGITGRAQLPGTLPS